MDREFTMNEKIAMLIEDFRQTHSVTQGQLAAHMNVLITNELNISSAITKGSISQWEKGTVVPNTIMMAVISKAKPSSQWEQDLADLATKIVDILEDRAEPTES